MKPNTLRIFVMLVIVSLTACNRNTNPSVGPSPSNLASDTGTSESSASSGTTTSPEPSVALTNLTQAVQSLSLNVQSISNALTLLKSDFNNLKAVLGALQTSIINAVWDIAHGGTGATTAPAARQNLGLGSVIVRYGNTNVPNSAPAGTTVLTIGLAHSSHYQHQNGRNVECISNKEDSLDRGGSWTQDKYSAVVYPVTTGNSDYLPSDIKPLKQITCATLYVPGITHLFRGKGSCPNNWSVVYSGYLLAGHYSHIGGSPSDICVAKGDDFDSSHPETSLMSRIYAVHTYSDAPTQGQPNLKWLPCIYCMKN